VKTGSSRLGLGGEAGQVLVIAGPALAAAVVGTIVQPQAFTFLGPWWGAGIAAGIVWNAVGLLFWGVAAVDLVVAFRADALATKRSFGLVRHPIFAWWLWFLVPGAALILNSWLFILADIAFFIGAVRGARAEEAALTARYGAAYDAYRSRVRMLVPIPHLRPLTIRRLVAFAGGGAVAVVAAVLGFALVARPVMLGYGQGKLETTVFAGDD
jgi:protein-S-isoprenylcysteine O-methyltransferase Ste14